MNKEWVVKTLFKDFYTLLFCIKIYWLNGLDLKWLYYCFHIFIYGDANVALSANTGYDFDHTLDILYNNLS